MMMYAWIGRKELLDLYCYHVMGRVEIKHGDSTRSNYDDILINDTFSLNRTHQLIHQTSEKCLAIFSGEVTVESCKVYGKQY